MLDNLLICVKGELQVLETVEITRKTEAVMVTKQTQPPAPQPAPQPPAQQQTHKSNDTYATYEDMFLQALSSETEKPSVTELIGSIRLEEVFGVNNSGGVGNGKPRLSQAVVLTLAHRLSEELGEGKNHLGREGANRLRWIWSCVESVDYQVRIHCYRRETEKLTYICVLFDFTYHLA